MILWNRIFPLAATYNIINVIDILLERIVTNMTKKIISIVKAIRVKSYIKNIFVFPALLFSNNLNNISILINSLIIFISFCFISSSIYLLNDIKDKDMDKLHPTKKDRPIASGELSVSFAYVLASVFLVASVCISLFLSWRCLLVVLIYFLINILYTLILKNISLFDVYCISIGFVLRVIAGALAINVEISSYLLMTVLMLSMFLGFAKRFSEARDVLENKTNTRAVLKDYSLFFLRNALCSMMTLTCLFYSFWTFDDDTVERIGSNIMIITVPIVIIGFLEYIHVIEKGAEGDPVTMIYGNKKLIGIMLLYIIVVITIIYL